MKGGYSFRRLNCNRDSILLGQLQKSIFDNTELSFRNKTLFGNG